MPRRILNLSLWDWCVIFYKGKFGGGLPSVFEYVLPIVNDKVLSKTSANELRKYSGIIVALAECGEKILQLYIVDESKRLALTKTVNTLRELAIALDDCQVTQEELSQTISAVIETINAWKSINTIQKVTEKSDGEVLETFVPDEIE